MVQLVQEGPAGHVDLVKDVPEALGPPIVGIGYVGVIHLGVEGQEEIDLSSVAPAPGEALDGLIPNPSACKRRPLPFHLPHQVADPRTTLEEVAKLLIICRARDPGGHRSLANVSE